MPTRACRPAVSGWPWKPTTAGTPRSRLRAVGCNLGAAADIRRQQPAAVVVARWQAGHLPVGPRARPCPVLVTRRRRNCRAVDAARGRSIPRGGVAAPGRRPAAVQRDRRIRNDALDALAARSHGEAVWRGALDRRTDQRRLLARRAMGRLPVGRQWHGGGDHLRAAVSAERHEARDRPRRPPDVVAGREGAVPGSGAEPVRLRRASHPADVRVQHAGQRGAAVRPGSAGQSAAVRHPAGRPVRGGRRPERGRRPAIRPDPRGRQLVRGCARKYRPPDRRPGMPMCPPQTGRACRTVTSAG